MKTFNAFVYDGNPSTILRMFRVWKDQNDVENDEDIEVVWGTGNEESMITDVTQYILELREAIREM